MAAYSRATTARAALEKAAHGSQRDVPMNRRFNREMGAAILQEMPDNATVWCDGSGYATREASDTCDTANEWTRRRHGLHATCICVSTTGVEVCGQCAMRQVGLRPKQRSVLCSQSRTTKTLPSLFHSDLDPLACYPSVLYFRLDPSRAHLPSSIRAYLRYACQKSSLDEVQSYQPLLNSRRPLLNTIYTRDKSLRWHLSSCANTKFVPLFGYRLKSRSKQHAHVYVQRRCSLASMPYVQDSS